MYLGLRDGHWQNIPALHDTENDALQENALHEKRVARNGKLRCRKRKTALQETEKLRCRKRKTALQETEKLRCRKIEYVKNAQLFQEMEKLRCRKRKTALQEMEKLRCRKKILRCFPALQDFLVA